MPVLPILIGFTLDIFIGDPHSLPHPVRLIGWLISKLENFFRNKIGDEKKAGTLLCVSVLIISTLIPALILFICYRINLVLGIIIESILCYYLIAARSLRDESMKVYKAIEKEDTESARLSLSMIVGRDTNVLDRDGMIRATGCGKYLRWCYRSSFLHGDRRSLPWLFLQGCKHYGFYDRLQE